MDSIQHHGPGMHAAGLAPVKVHDECVKGAKSRKGPRPPRAVKQPRQKQLLQVTTLQNKLASRLAQVSSVPSG